MPLLSYWPLNENSGDAIDIVGSNDGTVNGATQGAPGILGETAYDFDGSNDNIDIPDATDGLNAVTATVWLKSSGQWGSNGVPRFIGCSNNNFRQFYSDGDGWYFDVNDTRLQTSDERIINEWQFWTFLYDSDGLYNGDNLSIYLDGSEIASTGSETSTVGSGSKSLGDNPSSGGYEYGGKMAEVRLYNHALTPSEVQYLYQVGLSAKQISGKKTL